MRAGRLRLHAAVVIARRQIFEMVLTPGLYLTLAGGLLLGGLVVNAFVGSVDTSGFDPELNPVFALLARLLESGFGKAFADRIFSEGPFLLAFLAAFVPVFLFLAASSVFRFGLEKNVGAVELLTYGPADDMAYAGASYLRDVALTVAAMLVIVPFLVLTAAVHNLVLGPMFLGGLVTAVFLSLAIFAWGLLASAASSNAASSLAIFAAIMVVLLVLQAGTVAVGGSAVRSGAHAIGLVLRWVSPFYYGMLGARAVEVGSAVGFVGSMAALVALAALLAAASWSVMTRRGGRG